MGTFHEIDGRTVWIGRKAYPKPEWPLATLEPGGSFLIRMADGIDATGRTEPVIRAWIARYSRGAFARYHVHRVEGGLLVIRSDRPYIHRTRLR
jgi:hypothetical protein